MCAPAVCPIISDDPKLLCVWEKGRAGFFQNLILFFREPDFYHARPDGLLGVFACEVALAGSTTSATRPALGGSPAIASSGYTSGDKDPGSSQIGSLLPNSTSAGHSGGNASQPAASGYALPTANSHALSSANVGYTIPNSSQGHVLTSSGVGLGYTVPTSASGHVLTRSYRAEAASARSVAGEKPRAGQAYFRTTTRRDLSGMINQDRSTSTRRKAKANDRPHFLWSAYHN